MGLKSNVETTNGIAVRLLDASNLILTDSSQLKSVRKFWLWLVCIIVAPSAKVFPFCLASRNHAKIFFKCPKA
jgi:hypothetical protein